MKSKTQNVVGRSSAEADFRSMAHGICELLWLKTFMKDLRLLSEGWMKLHCVNEAAIAYLIIKLNMTKRKI